MIGSNIRLIREDGALRQSDLASSMNAVGFGDWTRHTVASVETGRRSVSVGELLTLAEVLLVPVADFFTGDVDVKLWNRRPGPGDTPVGWQLELCRNLLNEPAARERFQADAEMGYMAAYMDKHDRSITFPTLAAVEKFGFPKKTVDRVAQKLWGRSAEDEHKARMGERDLEGLTPRGLDATKGHVTRQLLAELEPILNKKGD
ncbi:MAG TPA: helix-turn-helix transcriptional regulator [Acidimicrobiales bacterium]|nr:helix-turn-helix transcriptional regulator [Acidimicrobiales bacterium]